MRACASSWAAAMLAAASLAGTRGPCCTQMSQVAAPPADAVHALAAPSGEAFEVTYATSSRCVVDWLDAHCGDTLGFDSETRPAYRKGQVYAPATMQLSTLTDALIVHLSHSEAEGGPAALREVLGDASVHKAGVGIDDDAVDMWCACACTAQHMHSTAHAHAHAHATRHIRHATIMRHATSHMPICTPSPRRLHWGIEVRGRVELGGDGRQMLGLKALAGVASRHRAAQAEAAQPRQLGARAAEQRGALVRRQ